MLSQERVAAFHRDGFVLGDQVLSDSEVEELRQELDRVIDNYQDETKPQPVRIANLGGDEQAPVWQIVNMWQASQPFRLLTHHPKIVAEVAQLLSAQELRIWHDQVQYKPSGTGGITGWHQDSPAWPNIAPKTTQISSWVALDNIDESNGCMSMVVGSHNWGVVRGVFPHGRNFDQMPDEFEGIKLEVRLCPVKKGYVHYHHALTWHGSHANDSGQKRRAIANHYMTEKTVYDETGGHIMKPFVTVNHGEKLVGEVFPLVWQKSTNQIN